MKHYTSSKFRDLYQGLPAEIQKLADKNYELLKGNPTHPSLKLKCIQNELWSVRVGDHYRALGIKIEDGFQWIWIGSHESYNKMI